MQARRPCCLSHESARGFYDSMSCRYHGVNAAASQQMFREMVQPVVERVCQGFNGCILAYGQTGEKHQPILVEDQATADTLARVSAADLPKFCTVQCT